VTVVVVVGEGEEEVVAAVEVEVVVVGEEEEEVVVAVEVEVVAAAVAEVEVAVALVLVVDKHEAYRFMLHQEFNYAFHGFFCFFSHD
jgi:hypothetical protein